jgi:hypothetical protein
MRESTNASADARKPKLQDVSTKEYLASPSGRLLACDATTNTDRPTIETWTSAKKDKVLRHKKSTNRGLEVPQRTHAQTIAGMGKRYPASPIRTIAFFPF